MEEKSKTEQITKNEIVVDKTKDENYIKLVDQSGVELALDRIIKKNNSLLPSNVVVEKIKNSASFYISNNEDLMALPKNGKLQMLYGVLKEAMIGLEAGNDYDIISFKMKPTIIRKKEGYYKIIDMIKPAEIVKFVNNVVIKGDEFDWNPVTEEIKHVPKNTSDKYEDIEYAYAYIKFANGFEKLVVMSKKDLDTIKKISPSGSTSFSPWNSMPMKMVKTKVVKELAKELCVLYSGRINAILSQAINSDEIPVQQIDEQGNIINDDSIYDIHKPIYDIESAEIVDV